MYIGRREPLLCDSELFFGGEMGGESEAGNFELINFKFISIFKFKKLTL